ncbi:MAG: universal stress protein [Chitinophagaceae bacterium]|nr:MAG: universal stress protein [Chitinophagaceae bacterium]
MKPIIVPTDFSAAALSAVNYAADMALALDAPLIIVHVYQIPIAVTETANVMIPVEELEATAEEHLAALKKDVRHITSNKLQIETEARLGDVAEELESCCLKHDPFLVIMGTTGHSAFERTVFGSTTLSVIKNSTYPLLAVPKGTEYGTGISRIGLAWDFTKTSSGLPLALIQSIVTAFRASLDVIHVDTANDHNTAQPTDPNVEQVLASVSARYHHVQHHDLGEGINAFAEKNNLDILITIPRKHSFFESLFNRSSTNELIQESHLPVLCIHAE